MTNPKIIEEQIVMRRPCPPPESPELLRLSSELSDLKKEHAALQNTCKALEKSITDLLLDRQRLWTQVRALSRPARPEGESRQPSRARERNLWCRGFSTALLFSPFIVYFGQSAIRLIRQGVPLLSEVQLCALACIAAGLLFRCLAKGK